jgi:hypothetical protein
MPMSPRGRFGWEEAAKVMVSVSCGHLDHFIVRIYVEISAEKRSPTTF